MSTKINALHPKYVGRAHMWVVTWFEDRTQHEKWFSTQAEAEAHYQFLVRKDVLEQPNAESDTQ